MRTMTKNVKLKHSQVPIYDIVSRLGAPYWVSLRLQTWHVSCFLYFSLALTQFTPAADHHRSPGGFVFGADPPR